jgi:LEA14-like dessication related protein
MMNFRSKLAFAGVILASFLLASCATLNEVVQKPKAKVSGVSIADLSVKQVTLDVLVDVYNPNPVALNTESLTLDLNVNQHSLAKLERSNYRHSIAAKGNSQITLPLTLTFDELRKLAGSLGDQDSLQYGINGELGFKLPVLGVLALPLEYSGELPIPKWPKVDIADVNVKQFNFSGVELEAKLILSNPNAFALDLNQFNYQLNAASNTIGSSRLSNVSLPAGASKTVTVPFSLSLSELGNSLVQMLRGKGPVTFELLGDMDIQPQLPAWKPQPFSFSEKKDISF